jgi:hypothetical protein
MATKKVTKKVSKKTKKTTKRGGGQPHKFKEEYCQVAIDMGRQGYSIRSIAAEIGHPHQTIYNWMDQFPQFFDAIKKSQDLALKYVEGQLCKLVSAGKTTNIDTTAVIFMLKTRFHKIYSDKKEIEHSGGNVSITYEKDAS